MRFITTPGRYANVTSTLALIVALGGSAYAALPDITGKNIKDHSITAADIKQGAIDQSAMAHNSIGSAQVKQDSLTGADIKANSITSAQISSVQIGDLGKSIADELKKAVSGSGAGQGVAGPAGPAGPTGPAGNGSGLLGYARVNADGSLDPTATKNITITSAANGVYCFDYTGGTPHDILLTVDISDADSRKDAVSGTTVAASVNSLCPAGSDIVVATASIQLTVNSPRAFYLAVVA